MKKIELYLVGILLVVALFLSSDWRGALASLKVDTSPKPYWLVKGEGYERKFISQNWECHVPLWDSTGEKPVMVSCSSRDGRQEMFYDHSSGVWPDELNWIRDFRDFEYFEP